ELVGTQRALQRMTTEALDEIRATDDDPGLRSAEELVAGEADEIGASGKGLPRGRLVADVDERARAEVVDERKPVAARDRGELLDTRLLGESDDAEVRLVHAEEECRLVRHSALVVVGARAVRRADLAEPRARAGEHVGNPKAVADLDQLAARN